MVAHVADDAVDVGALFARDGALGAPATPFVLAMGNEQQGATAELLAAADHRFVLPRAGLSDSLNVNASLAASLQTAHLCGRLQPDASEHEQEQLIREWVRRAIGR